MSKKIVVAGHTCLDITPKFPPMENARIEDVIVPGRVVNLDGVEFSVGGAVSSTGLCLKLLGADVSLMGKIGNDGFGTIISGIYSKYDAAGSLIISDDTPTSYTVALALPGVDRVLLHDPAANNSFSNSDMDWDEIGNASLFHFAYPPIMRNYYRDGARELVALYQKVHGMGVATSMDMAVLDPASEAYRVDWEDVIRRCMPYLDFFVPSVEELCMMIDRPLYDSVSKLAAGGDFTSFITMSQVRSLADRLMDMGARVLMIKCGSAGLYVRTGPKERISEIPGGVISDCDIWADVDHFEECFVPRRIRSGTGAGDTSIAAFLKAVTDGYSPSDCARLAAATGANCVAEYDTLSGVVPLPELMKRINGGWAKSRWANLEK